MAARLLLSTLERKSSWWPGKVLLACFVFSFATGQFEAFSGATGNESAAHFRKLNLAELGLFLPCLQRTISAAVGGDR